MGEEFVLNRLRIKFMRGEEVKYISHLDMLKVFERAVRRAKIPIAYSQGFNPHPQIIFGLPLSVGVTSDAEYADFELTEPVTPEDFMDKLNRQLPSGLRVISAKHLNAKSNIMKSITRASYTVIISWMGEGGIDGVKAAVRAFFGQGEVLVQKKGKKGMKEVNIRPMVYDLEVKTFSDICISEYKEDSACILMTVDAGIDSNLKPELVISSLNDLSEMDINVEKVHRTALYVNSDGSVLDPMNENALL